MATGLKFHTRRNPASGRRWKSVYTPDVLAVGEGPSSWGDFFCQQMRWSRGTFEVLLKEMIFRLPRLSPGRALHYILITTFYPSMAIGWVLGAVNACLFLALGVQGVVVPVQLWLALYIDATAFQLWVYLRNRRYNVSPYEPEGSSGIKGMLMSIFAAPIFAASLIATILRLPAKFVVTPKGLSSSADHILTFRRHLQWAALLIGAIVLAIFQGYADARRAAVARRRAGRLPRPARAVPGRAHRRAPARHRRRAARRAARRPLRASPPSPSSAPRSTPCSRPGSATRRSPRPEAVPAGVGAREADRTGAVPEGDLPAGWVRTASLAGRDRRAGTESAPRPTPRDGRPDRPTTDRPTPDARPTPGRRHARDDTPVADPTPSPVPRSRPTPGPAPLPGQPGPQGQPGQPPRPGPHPGPQAPQGPPASRRPAPRAARRPAGSTSPRRRSGTASPAHAASGAQPVPGAAGPSGRASRRRRARRPLRRPRRRAPGCGPAAPRAAARRTPGRDPGRPSDPAVAGTPSGRRPGPWSRPDPAPRPASRAPADAVLHPGRARGRGDRGRDAGLGGV